MSSSANITKRLHIAFTPSVPASGPEELTKSLTAHFGKFGTVKSVDGLGELDGVGMPRKFGFISIEGSEAGITKCVNSLSGSIWKGVKVRVGDARPDFDQRIARENAEEPAPPRRKRKRGGVHAEDMTPVTPETAAQRASWKVTEMGRIMRPVRIRPAWPLPPPLVAAVPKKPKDTSKKDDSTKKPKKRRDPDSRARRRTIDMTRWGSVHLKGMFLEDAGQALETLSQDEVIEMMEADLSDSSSDSERGGDEPAVEAPVQAPPPTRAVGPVAAPGPIVPAKSPVQVVDSTQREPRVVPDPPAASDVDLATEKNQSLSLLNSLFAAGDTWAGRESVGSDVDEEELLKIGGNDARFEDDDAIEFVPMDVDVDVQEPEVRKEVSPAPQPPPKAPTQATKLKDLFVSREEDVGFSLLGHLDLDLELDEELVHVVPEPDSLEPTKTAPQLAFAMSTAPSHVAPAHIALDAKAPLFFPLPSSFSAPGLSSTKARQRDILDVGKDHGWDAHFQRNETDEEIRAKWEKEKVELTREWNRRWREAGKVRRRRGGGDGDQ
ncbi:hypothetical protein B0H14DRAFT_3082928 [Mycena olivaceomarginata]|nr:hypothetical protein B0H14DRAFT_3082928 [Mycena olivaceomarginata]